MDTKSMDNDQKIDHLLDELQDSRNDIKSLLDKLEEVRTKISEGMLPDKFDNRYKYIYYERIKSVNDVYRTILDMRKEINKTLKDEIELRRKITSSNESENDKFISIPDLLEQVKGKLKK